MDYPTATICHTDAASWAKATEQTVMKYTYARLRKMAEEMKRCDFAAPLGDSHRMTEPDFKHVAELIERLADKRVADFIARHQELQQQFEREESEGIRGTTLFQ